MSGKIPLRGPRKDSYRPDLPTRSPIKTVRGIMIQGKQAILTWARAEEARLLKKKRR